MIWLILSTETQVHSHVRLLQKVTKILKVITEQVMGQQCETELSRMAQIMKWIVVILENTKKREHNRGAL